MLTKEEKEKRVIELYQQDATYREICKELHLAPGNISSIIKRYTGEQQVNPEPKLEIVKLQKLKQKQLDQDQGHEQTVDTNVFKLFEEGKTPIQVAINLNLPPVEVTRLQREYWRLKGLQVLEDIYEDIKNEVFQFHRVYKLIKDEGHTPIQLIEVANILDDLPLLRSEHQLLEQDNQNLRNEKEQLNGSIIAAKENLSAINIDLDVK